MHDATIPQVSDHGMTQVRSHEYNFGTNLLYRYFTSFVMFQLCIVPNEKISTFPKTVGGIAYHKPLPPLINSIHRRRLTPSQPTPKL